MQIEGFSKILTKFSSNFSMILSLANHVHQLFKMKNTLSSLEEGMEAANWHLICKVTKYHLLWLIQRIVFTIMLQHAEQECYQVKSFFGNFMGTNIYVPILNV